LWRTHANGIDDKGASSSCVYVGALRIQRCCVGHVQHKAVATACSGWRGDNCRAAAKTGREGHVVSRWDAGGARFFVGVGNVSGHHQRRVYAASADVFSPCALPLSQIQRQCSSSHWRGLAAAHQYRLMLPQLSGRRRTRRFPVFVCLSRQYRNRYQRAACSCAIKGDAFARGHIVACICLIDSRGHALHVVCVVCPLLRAGLYCEAPRPPAQCSHGLCV